MSLFLQSTKAVSAACQEIADCVGASGDPEMTNRAWRSLVAGIEHFNNRANWDYLRVEADPVKVYAPFSVTGVTASGGQASAAAPTGHGILPNDIIIGNYWPTVSRVSATAAGGFGFVLTSGLVGTAVSTVQFYRDMYPLPGDWKAPYDMRLQLSNRPLNYVGRRLYDRSVVNEINNTTTFWYDLFVVGSKGSIRMLAPPMADDILQMRYYRRMTVPTTSATADAVDIVQDYEPYLIAYGKWHFLVDKGDGRGDQAKTWLSMSQDGLTTMLRDQTRIPDEGLMFLPGASQPGQLGDNTTRWLPWDW